jgi:hypothetical protein
MVTAGIGFAAPRRAYFYFPVSPFIGGRPMKTLYLPVSALAALVLALSPGLVVADVHGGVYEECAKACNACQLECDQCATHCAQLIVAGKKEPQTTLHPCLDCATHCSAAARIVAQRGPFSDTICTACAEACKRCGDQCNKFRDDPVMKQCADECYRCEKACRDMLKHKIGRAHV